MVTMLRDIAMRIETFIHNEIVSLWLPNTTQTQVDSDFLKNAVESLSDEHDLDTDVEWLFVDEHYFAPEGPVKRFTEILSILPYRPERYDCEDYSGLYKTIYAFALGINSVGLVVDWTGGHAYNVLITSDGKARLIEPQNNEVVVPGSEEKYAFERVFIYI